MNTKPARNKGRIRYAERLSEEVFLGLGYGLKCLTSLMEKVSSRPHGVRFAAFAVNLQAGEPRKYGVKIRLQEQPYQMLSVLLERPSKVVAREELQKRLWSGNTFVDFEHSLTTAVKKLKAEGPRPDVVCGRIPCEVSES